MNCVPFFVVLNRRNLIHKPHLLDQVECAACDIKILPWGRREWLFSTIVMRALALARNRAGVDLAMPTPLMRTSMASSNVVLDV